MGEADEILKGKVAASIRRWISLEQQTLMLPAAAIAIETGTPFSVMKYCHWRGFRELHAKALILQGAEQPW